MKKKKTLLNNKKKNKMMIVEIFKRRVEKDANRVLG